APEARWQDMYDATRWYGRRGAAIHAMAAVDMALWDIVGKHLGQPCHAVWGTRRRRVRAYASVLFRDDAAASAALAAESLARGFSAIEFGWGRFGRDRDWDIASLQAIRGAVRDVDLMVDAGRIWTADESARRAPELFERFGLRWLEEPLHEDDLAGYAQLAAAVAPGWIAAGETEEREADFSGLLDRGVKVIQPDIGRAGGPTVCRPLSA